MGRLADDGSDRWSALSRSNRQHYIGTQVFVCVSFFLCQLSCPRWWPTLWMRGCSAKITLPRFVSVSIAALFANALTFAQWLSLRDVDSLPRNAFCAFCLAMFGALPFLSVAQYFCRALRLCRTNKAAVKAPMTRILRAPNCSFHKKCPQRRTAMPKMRRSASSPLRRGCRSRRSLCGTHSLRFAQCANFETFFVF